MLLENVGQIECHVDALMLDCDVADLGAPAKIRGFFYVLSAV